MSMIENKINSKQAVISIFGLGYVGYPLACLFSNAGFKVIGFDVDEKKINDIKNKNVSWSGDYTHNENFFPTTNKDNLKDSDIFIITVQTPLKQNNVPDLSYIESATEMIKENMKKGSLVILESTSFPGTTEEVVKPILEESELKAGEDFYLCFSPERIDPGNKKWRLENIPKPVGGVNKKSCEIACLLYSKIMENVIPVSSTRVAEAAKIMENVFRGVNIALVNELAKVFEKLNIDTWEVIDVAATKPYAFMPHYPGPGVGGHCIPDDPFYLAYRAKKEGKDTRFIELAGEINRSMPYHVLNLIKKSVDKDLKDCKVAVLGVTYKKNVPDIRNTPAEVIINELRNMAKDVVVFDPLSKETFGAKIDNFENTLTDKDCIVLLTDYTFFREKEIEKLISEKSPNSVVIDTKRFIKPELLNNVKYKCLGK